MKNHLIVYGIVFVLLIVCFSGCTEVGIGVTNIGDITANPDKYMGKSVTVEGTCYVNWIEDDKGHTIYFKYNNNLQGVYRITGIIEYKEGDIFSFKNLYINVTTAKAL